MAPADLIIDDLIVLTQQLVRIDSSNPTLSQAKGGGESKIADFVSEWLEARSIEVHRLEARPGRPSIVGIVRGTGGGKSMMLNGHIDTVSLDSYASSEDALSGDIDAQGRLYGRGSMDMKGGLAAAMISLSKAKSLGSLRGDVILTAVADEEDSSLGTIEVLNAGWSADAAIVCEPTMLDVVHAHKGFLWVEFEIQGVAAHGSRPDQGIDAILLARHVLNALEDYRNLLPTHPSLGPASLHAGLIKGGEEPSSYPKSCTLTVEFRTVPPQTTKQILGDLTTMLREISTREQNFRYAPPRLLCERAFLNRPKNDYLVQMVHSSITQVLGREPRIRSETFWTDAALIGEAGIPVVVFGPSGNGLHSRVEWADTNSIKQTQQALSIVVERFCG